MERKHHVRRIEKHLAKVYNALPDHGEKPVDYETMRSRVPLGINTIRRALMALVVDGRAVAVSGGLRGRKAFRRVELYQDVDSAAAASTTTPANNAIATNRRTSSIIHPNTA